jgi:hypothetical protein
MGLIDLVVTVCALSLPGQCEEQHLSFSADMSLNQCVMMRSPTSRSGSTSIQNGSPCGGGATMAAPRRKASPSSGVVR